MWTADRIMCVRGTRADAVTINGALHLNDQERKGGVTLAHDAVVAAATARAG